MLRFSSPAKLFIWTCLLFITFWTYGKLVFYRDPGSLLFFDPSRAYEKKYSTIRENEVLDFRRQTLQQLRHNNVTARRQSITKPKVCATIISVDRNIPGVSVHPLEFTIYSALASLSEIERQQLQLNIYIAHTNPSTHSLWNSPTLNVTNHIIDGVYTPQAVDTSGEVLQKILKHEQNNDLNAKTALDFSLALKSCSLLAPKAKYVALIEGDVLFAEGWFAHTLAGLAQIQNMEDVSQYKRTWLDLRLFHPESNTGWSERRLLGNHVPQIILAINACILTAILALRCRKRKSTNGKSHPTWISNAVVLVVCVFTIPIVVVSFFAAGKSSLASLITKPGIYKQNWGCCTQGIVFPAWNVQSLIRNLQQRAGETTTDWMIMQHAQQEKLDRYILHPVLVQHRGVMSSIITPDRDQDKANGLLWSIAFEDLKSNVLKQQHSHIISKLFTKPG